MPLQDRPDCANLPKPYQLYRHFKGGTYAVLGLAQHLTASDPCPAHFAQAQHSEKRSVMLNVGFFGNAKLFYYHEDDIRHGLGEDLVIYWSFPKECFFARPVRMWSDIVDGVERFGLVQGMSRLCHA